MNILLIAVLATAVAVGGTTGAGWYLAAHDRDQAQAELATERAANEELRGAVREQNRAVEAMGAAKIAADERRAAAEKLAAANGRRFDAALAGLAGARATTCEEAMPAVNKMLESVR